MDLGQVPRALPRHARSEEFARQQGNIHKNGTGLASSFWLKEGLLELRCLGSDLFLLTMIAYAFIAIRFSCVDMWEPPPLCELFFRLQFCR